MRKTLAYSFSSKVLLANISLLALPFPLPPTSSGRHLDALDSLVTVLSALRLRGSNPQPHLLQPCLRGPRMLRASHPNPGLQHSALQR